MLWSFIFVGLIATSIADYMPGVPNDFDQYSNAVLSAMADDVVRKFEIEYMKYLKTGIESPALKQIARQLASNHNGKDIFIKDWDKLPRATEYVVCIACRAFVNVVTRNVRDLDDGINGLTKEETLKKIAMDFCRLLNLQTEEVCGSLIDSFYPTTLYIAENSEMESQTFCSLFMEFGLCNVKQPEYKWTLNIDTNGPAITGPKNNIPAINGNEMQILHVTDIHYDPLYKPNSLAECVEPLCCQRHEDVAAGTSEAAGYWGDFRECDLPLHTIENAFDHMKNTHTNIKYVYQTGDIVDHMVWGTSVEKNVAVIKDIQNKLGDAFPNAKVYPCIGNHEPHPLNLFSPEDAPTDINTHWLYEELYDNWKRWLPESTKDTILKGGYYTVSPETGFRIIAVNSIFCYLDNFWIFYSGTDKIEQLEWLHDTLLAAEKAGENVHILTHIPSGDGTCWSTWSREYNRIVERFSHVISGIFNGHTHKDEMNVYYSSNGHAIGLSWNAGSLTTFTYKNPNYRVYHVEPAKMQVVDHETWIFNLTEANIHGADKSPEWIKEYVFSSEFTDNLSPGGIDQLLDKMADNPDLLRTYWKYKMTSADPRLQDGCDRNCLIGTLCRLATTVNDQKDRCNELTERLIYTLDNTPSTTPKDDDDDDDDDDGGAAAIIAMRLTSLLALYFAIKYLI